MDESTSAVMEIYIQDGVLLKFAPSAYKSYINSSGTVSITEYLNSNRSRFIEWKPDDLTIDSDIQDQEWALVNTVERRTRTLSGASDVSTKTKCIKVNFADINSFKPCKNNQKLIFHDGRGDPLIGFVFQHGNCSGLVGTLKELFRPIASKRDRHLFILDQYNNSPETQRLTKSFAELNLFNDEPSLGWRIIKNLQTRPYETTMEAFSKLTDYVYKGPEEIRMLDESVKDLLNRSMSEINNTTTAHTHGDYEVIQRVPKLPERKEFPRGSPVTVEQWRCLQDYEGRIEDIETLKLVIYRGGLVPQLRKEVWKFLLDYYPWNSSFTERKELTKKKNAEYYVMKLQWRSMTKVQEDNFADYRDRKSLIEKDVNRTDRTLDYYAGDNNPNLQTLSDVLMTYVMYNFDLGYVQGMSDLLSPILYLMENEAETFWCFVGFMNKLISNFDIDQAGMKELLQQLHTLLAFAVPELASYLDKHDSGNMFFCFRWLLVWFKREFSYEDIIRLWEVMWTGLPCDNFHLLICVAILDSEKETLMNNYGFTEILKHINELSGNLNVNNIINKAEGMFYQIKEAEHLTNEVRDILGLPLIPTSSPGSPSAEGSDTQPCLFENVSISPDEVVFERPIASKRYRHLFILDQYNNSPETQRLTKSFAELNLFNDEPSLGWRIIKNLQTRPYETTMEAFSKLTDYVYKGPEEIRMLDESVKDLLNRSMSEINNTTTAHTHGDYEVIQRVPKLPERKEFPRGSPVTVEQWRCLQDYEGRIEDIETLKLVIYRGGLVPQLQKEVWKFLLDYYPWNSSFTERKELTKKKKA